MNQVYNSWDVLNIFGKVHIQLSDKSNNTYQGSIKSPCYHLRQVISFQKPEKLETLHVQLDRSLIAF